MQDDEEQNEREVKYRSPIRYVIIYNDIFDTSERRIEILLDKKNFNNRAITESIYGIAATCEPAVRVAFRHQEQGFFECLL